MLVPSLALMILCFGSTISYATQPKAPTPAIKKLQKASLTEDEREDLVFAIVSKRQALALFSRGGAKITQFKGHKNFNLQTGTMSCAAK